MAAAGMAPDEEILCRRDPGTQMMSTMPEQVDTRPVSTSQHNYKSMATKIEQLKTIYVSTDAFHLAQEKLKKYKHVTLCGAPGDGKTSIALMICDIYRQQKHQILFVENIEDFDINVIISQKGPILIVFDDVFGTTTVPDTFEKRRKVFKVLLESLEQHCVISEPKLKKQNRSLSQEEDDCSHKNVRRRTKYLEFIFTSKTYNLNEGIKKMFLYKANLFKTETIVDLTEKRLTTTEKATILRSYKERHKQWDITDGVISEITNIQNAVFGFPLTCRLISSTPEFQRNTLEFFRHPLTYLRDDIDAILQERSSRAAAFTLLVICGGKLDLVKILDEKNPELRTKFEAVKQLVPLCTRTEISEDIRSFHMTYVTLEKNVASFSHPAIYDAAACSLGKMNSVLLLEHCSLKFLFERVRVSNTNTNWSPRDNDVATNMIYIDESMYPTVVRRMANGIRSGHYRMTLTNPILNHCHVASLLLNELDDDFTELVQGQGDRDTKESLLYWVSLSDCGLLFERTLDTICEKTPGCLQSLCFGKTPVSQKSKEDLSKSLLACIQNGKLDHLKQIWSLLNTAGISVVNITTWSNKTLPMLAAEAGYLNILEYLLGKGVDLSPTDNIGKTCLHYAVQSGSIAIVRLIFETSSDLITKADACDHTPSMTCAKAGHEDVLKFLFEKTNCPQEYLTAVDEHGNNCLHLACYEGHASVVKYLLSLKIFDVNAVGLSDMTPIMMAAVRGHFNTYQILLSSGADLSSTDMYKTDCLMLACIGGNPQIVCDLLNTGMFDINKRETFNDMTPLMIAAKTGNSEIYGCLVERGADQLLVNRFDSNCLSLACEGGQLCIVQKILSAKQLDINKEAGLFKLTPIMIAAQSGNPEIFEFLTKNDAIVSSTEDCLKLACQGGSVRIVKHLIQNCSSDINKTYPPLDQSLLMLVISRGHYDVFQFLLSKGANFKNRDRNNRNCLLLACEGCNSSIVKDLLLFKFDVNERGGSLEQTPVMVAARRGNFDIFSILIEAGADLSKRDINKRDCFMLACMGGNMQIVNHLISTNTFQINRKDRMGKTPLMIAVEEGFCHIYYPLTLRGADPWLTDESNSDCLMKACQHGHLLTIANILSQKTNNINRKNKFGLTPLMIAIQRGHYPVYKLLVSNGADVSVQDKQGKDCLMMACEVQNVSIVKHILSLQTLDINRRDEGFGHTPVMVAAGKGHFVLYSLLVSQGADPSAGASGSLDCLMLACQSGNVDIVKHLLSLELFNVNKRCPITHKTPLMMAQVHGYADVCSVLASHGADLLHPDEEIPE